ncbi:MAG: hypothetical protein NC344_06010 [Bacteroidales bacterium]|nr:hypothetical protein [Bacteroidales bacterium]MCM1147375.1 hypothetical protein [Bacteroidales bacterium]MCM1207190.1 hypothetical protein [Bacillota bacterium]MCM1510423.1 hypothetical protein [Clostridium sp.]
MDKKEIEKACNMYIVQLLGIIVVLYVLCEFLTAFGIVSDAIIPVTVSCIFLLAVGSTISLIWKKVAISSPASLTTFFTAVSGFRMLLALITLFGCYVAVGRENMSMYVIVFMACYLVSIAHHAMFFARINNKN